jgi:hypothetical protein
VREEERLSLERGIGEAVHDDPRLVDGLDRVDVTVRRSINDVDAEGAREELCIFKNVVPRHTYSAQRLDTLETGEVAAPNFDALDGRRRKRRLPQLAPLEQNVLE